MNTHAPPARGSIGELTLYFLRLGLLGFGGPVALVGQMERELVAERGWLSSEQMRESIAICQSLPGPLAIQVGIYISYLRGGFWGAWAGGWAFILPNFVIVAALGALYVYLGDLQPVTAIFYGVSPAVIALILHSCYRLAKLGMEDPVQWAIAAVCLVVTVILNAEVALLFIGAGVIGILYYGNLIRRQPPILLQVSAAPVLAQLAPGRGAATRQISRQPKCPGLREGRLRGSWITPNVSNSGTRKSKPAASFQSKQVSERHSYRNGKNPRRRRECYRV
jgi:chromate transporter